MDARSFAAATALQTVSQPFAAKTNERGPSLEELDNIQLPDHGLLHSKPALHKTEATSTNALPPKAIVVEDATPRTPSELEASPPATPTRQHEVVGLAPSWSYPAMNKWRILAACLTYFGNGMIDSAPGALLPYIESYYHVNYAIVSLIWVTNAVGFISAAFCTEAIQRRVGRAWALVISEAFMAVAFVMISCTPPFGVVIAAYFFSGFGYTINLALNNVFCANLSGSTVILGLVHGSYGIGGVVAPIAATAMVSSGVLWSRFFIIMVAIRLLCLVFSGWSFREYEKEEVSQFANSLQQITSRQSARAPGKLRSLGIGRALRNRTSLMGALFIVAYQVSLHLNSIAWQD